MWFSVFVMFIETVAVVLLCGVLAAVSYILFRIIQYLNRWR